MRPSVSLISVSLIFARQCHLAYNYKYRNALIMTAYGGVIVVAVGPIKLMRYDNFI